MNNDFEPVDNTPVAIPTRLRLPQTRTDQLRAFIRAELSRQAADQGHETFQEADDLEPDDEEAMPFSQYEMMALEPPAAEQQGTAPLQNGSGAEGAPPVGPAASSEGTPSPSPEAGNGSS